MNLNRLVDHTLLKADATDEQIQVLCEQAAEHEFMSVCVNPIWVKQAAKYLAETNVKVCTVIGFPLGATTSEVKEFEAKNAIQNGATEVDMVINIGALKDKNYDIVLNDIKKVVDTSKGKALVKVIIETALLTKEEIIKVCALAKEADADFVKTSTGFSSNGAQVEDIELMRKTVGDKMGVKASGGIKTVEVAEKMVNAGASRIGTSSAVSF